MEPLDNDDVTDVAQFVNSCWREAYAGILDSGFLTRLTADSCADRIRERMKVGGCFTARDEGVLVGMVLYGPAHLPELKGGGEISMLYVRAQSIGTGIGHRLLAAAEEALCEQGYTTVGLDVYSANLRAARFYEAHGYVTIGNKVDLIEGVEYPLDIMAKPVSPHAID